jgi:hypothetical protein
MILYSIVLPLVSPAARIIAPFLHHFCTMKRNSKNSVPGARPKPWPKVAKSGQIWPRIASRRTSLATLRLLNPASRIPLSNHVPAAVLCSKLYHPEKEIW